jgi:hypothetical protein
MSMKHSLLPLRATTAVKPGASLLKICLALIFAISLLVCACSSRESAKGPEAPPPSAAASHSEQLSQPPPPNLVEVQEAAKRVFKDAALLDSSRNPSFLGGDFNGDGSQDIAVIIKPAPGKLSQLNQEFPPWILRDPFISVQPGMPRLRVAATDLLLAVIHGYGQNGWRDPEATQTYLLKNAVGSNTKTFSKSDLVAANQGKNLPRIVGDSIGEVLRGSSGYLYFADATYSWYDPTTFKGAPERRVVHPGATTRTELLHIRGKAQIPVEK